MGLFPKKLLIRRARVKLSEEMQLAFLKRLHRLFENGYSFVRALEVIKWDANFVETAVLVEKTLMAGKHIDEAFEKAAFHPTIISYLYFIRVNGDIAGSIAKCIQMFEHRMKQLNKFKRVVRYPIVLCIVFLMLLFFLKTSVLPAFNDIFGMSSTSSKTISTSMFMIDLLTTIAIIFGVGGILGTIFWQFYKKNMAIDRQIVLYEKIPIFHMFIRLQTSYYFATHMGMFLKTGMSMKDVITHMKEQKKLPIIAYYAELMMMELASGYYIDQLLDRLPLIEKQLALLFRKNENVKALEQDLTIYADFLTETMEQKIMKGLSMIQPIFFGLLACMIIFIYITLMWPMFQLIQTI
jgi:competence protein ComGB